MECREPGTTLLATQGLHKVKVPADSCSFESVSLLGLLSAVVSGLIL